MWFSPVYRHPDIIRDIPGNITTTEALLDDLHHFNNYTIHLSVKNAVGLEGEPAITTEITLALRKPALFLSKSQ